jgi:hypothetical protein
MKTRLLIATAILLLTVPASFAASQQKTTLGDNAALRYWAAFSQMQDSAITDEEAKKLSGILAGSVPYDDLNYKDLVEKNRFALDTMARGTVSANCDWGLDYPMGTDTPVDYVRKALELGRLNVLYVFHLAINGDKDGAVRALVAGVRFSHDVANGGPLFAAVVAKELLTTHFRAIGFVEHTAGLTATQRVDLKKAIAGLGPSGLDWQSAIRRDLAALNKPEWQAPMRSIAQNFMAALNDRAALPDLAASIAKAPQELQQAVPNPVRVLDEQRDLAEQLKQIRLVL